MTTQRSQPNNSEEGKAKAALAYLIDHIVYSDSYGVPKSDFQACHLCRGGGAPGVAMIHDPDCPVLRCEGIAEEWWQDYYDNQVEEIASLKARIEELEKGLENIKKFSNSEYAVRTARAVLQSKGSAAK
jgi:hypothetical protein